MDTKQAKELSSEDKEFMKKSGTRRTRRNRRRKNGSEKI